MSRLIDLGPTSAVVTDTEFASGIRYPQNDIAVSGTTPSVNISDRYVNGLTLGSSVTSVTFRFPARTDGKMRDFFIFVDIEGTTTPTINFVDTAQSNSPAVVYFGDESLSKIGPGSNLILFSEIWATGLFVVSVKHRDSI